VTRFLLLLEPDPGPSLKITSIAAALAGSLVSLAAVLQLRSAGRRDTRGRPGGLYTGGLFSVCRNPIQVGMHLTWIGWMAALPTAAMLIGFILYLPHKHRRILKEERHLERIYGARYRRYRRRVGRYFPWPYRRASGGDGL
jgi:protein-S-isoprenylcysteine O-methyltransferase Ste14